jgi:uncharacterized protein
MRVVLDSNIIVSALLSGQGNPARVLDAWRRARFELVTSEEQLEELRRVTRYERLRPLIKPAAAGVLINTLRTQAQVLPSLPAVDRSADPGDNFLLAMVEAGEAEYLVTGDKQDLLALKQHGRAKIITASELIAFLGKSGRGGKRTQRARPTTPRATAEAGPPQAGEGTVRGRRRGKRSARRQKARR